MLEIVKPSPPKKAKPRKPRATKAGPTPEQVQVRAYEIYLERGGAPGDPLQDWLQAERELQNKPRKARRTKSKAA
jgi:Protein of unknown function (DUF2934)